MILRSEIQDVLFLDIETNAVNNLQGLSDMENNSIICICVGKIGSDEQDNFLKLRCFYNENEYLLLLEFNAFLQKLKPETVLYAHNGKEFDFPFIAHRMSLYEIELPEILSKNGNKLMELQLLDTKDFWGYFGLKAYTSLEFLSYIFKIDKPSNQQVSNKLHTEYYFQNDLQRVIDYCYRDVVTIAQLLLRFNNQNTIRTENIYYV
jgi:DNA polymerase elongation subunit (family B)